MAALNLAQELLSTFSEELDEVSLMPAKKGGMFEIRHNQDTVWSREKQKRFPEISELKQLIRDQVAPERSLGHVDKSHGVID